MITKYNDTDLQNLLSFIPGLTGRTVVDRANLYYSGAIAGSEFLTYAVTKIYLCKQFNAGHVLLPTLINSGSINFYNESDVETGRLSGRKVFYDGGAAPDITYIYNAVEIKNILFSRIVPQGSLYERMIFRGMRITLSA